jgi:hypothetical protein
VNLDNSCRIYCMEINNKFFLQQENGFVTTYLLIVFYIFVTVPIVDSYIQFNFTSQCLSLKPRFFKSCGVFNNLIYLS